MTARTWTVFGVVVALAAPLAYAQPTTAEFKCEAATSKSEAKFFIAKTKCIDRCLNDFWKGKGPESDCLPPSYGGATAFCIFDSLKGVESKASLAIKKACDPATRPTNECPSCYDGGDCTESGSAASEVYNWEGRFDSYMPGIWCERAGADPDEQKCQRSTAKAIARHAKVVLKCYDRCKWNEFRGTVQPGVCDPPASDPATQTCASIGFTKAAQAIDKICRPPGLPDARPDCPGPNEYPDGTTWANLNDIWFSGDIPATYCEN